MKNDIQTKILNEISKPEIGKTRFVLEGKVKNIKTHNIPVELLFFNTKNSRFNSLVSRDKSLETADLYDNKTQLKIQS